MFWSFVCDLLLLSLHGRLYLLSLKSLNIGECQDLLMTKTNSLLPHPPPPPPPLPQQQQQLLPPSPHPHSIADCNQQHSSQTPLLLQKHQICTSSYSHPSQAGCASVTRAVAQTFSRCSSNKTISTHPMQRRPIWRLRCCHFSCCYWICSHRPSGFPSSCGVLACRYSCCLALLDSCCTRTKRRNESLWLLNCCSRWLRW